MKLVLIKDDGDVIEEWFVPDDGDALKARNELQVMFDAHGHNVFVDEEDWRELKKLERDEED